MRRRGFTLIELLVVIGIIVVLVGILLPALSRSRQIGLRTKCAASLHSLCAAVQMYADNNDGRLPTGGLAHGGSVDEGMAWINIAAQEIGAEQVVHCPSDDSPYWNQVVPGTDQKRRMSYANNYYLMGTVDGREEYTSLTRVKRPSATIFWAELTKEGDFAASDHVHPETWFANPRSLAMREVDIERHIKQANYGFLDGHSEAQRFEDTYTLNVSASHFPNLVWSHNKYDPLVGW